MIATQIKTTVHIDWTSAPTVRMHANVDMPEYGIRKDENFYLVRASANDGTYYIVTWSYEQIAWQCPCKHSVIRPNAKSCRHKNQVSAFCKARSDARKAIENARTQSAREARKQVLQKQEGLVQAPNGNWVTPEQLASVPVTSIERRLATAGFMRK